MVSGGFDPLHIGHVKLIESAAHYGEVWVALNSDEWLYRKKGFFFMGWEERCAILKAMKFVAQVVPVNDADGTVCDALRNIRPNIFANGGDRHHPNIAEASICRSHNIEQIFNVGGGKIQSSSSLVRAASECGTLPSRDPHEDPISS